MGGATSSSTATTTPASWVKIRKRVVSEINTDLKVAEDVVAVAGDRGKIAIRSVLTGLVCPGNHAAEAKVREGTTDLNAEAEAA